MIREAEILHYLNHPNILAFIDLYVEPKHICLVTDSQHMNARQYVNDHFRSMTSRDVKKIFHQAMQAVQFCHESGVIHRDIKLDNILLSVDTKGKIFDVKLGDFGKAIRFSSNEYEMHGMCGTIGYMAPEMLRPKSKYGKAVDLWCMGVCLYALVAGELPFFCED